MAAIPSFILKKLYVPGSLCNIANGCQVQIKNTLAPATITGFGTVMVDGVVHPQADVVLTRGTERISAADCGPRHPISFDVNVIVTIIIRSVRLGPGEHHLTLDVTSRETGRVKIEIADSVHD
jgi:hypothetical protein